MLVFAAYSAQLVSGLTIVKLGVPFSTWEGFYHHGDQYKIGAIDSSPKRLEVSYYTVLKKKLTILFKKKFLDARSKM